MRLSALLIQSNAFCRNDVIDVASRSHHYSILYSPIVLQPSYQTSSYRGEDRAFHIRGEPQLYTFAALHASDCVAKEDVQLFCHFNVYLHHEHQDDALSYSQQVMQQRLHKHIQETLPSGWRGQVFFVKIMGGKEGGCIIVYKVCFFGETTPILQAEADRYRALVQDIMVADHLPLLLRRHWAISNPYPASILSSILQADRQR